MSRRGSKIVGQAIDLGIVVRDVDACLRFYGEFLGMMSKGRVLLRGGASLYQLSCGGSTIKLLDYGNDSSPRTLTGANPGLRYWTVQVRGLDELVAAGTRAGHRLLGGPIEIADDTRVAVFEDPDGNKIELLERTPIAEVNDVGPA